MTTVQVSPEFAIIGVRDDDKCWLIASDSLIQAELEHKVEVEPIGWFERVVSKQWYEMRGTMHQVVVAQGRDFAEAMANLMGFWKPKEPTRAALGEPGKELPHG